MSRKIRGLRRHVLRLGWLIYLAWDSQDDLKQFYKETSSYLEGL